MVWIWMGLLLGTQQQAAFAQAVIRGRVLDKTTREPLELAVVTELPSGRTALTDRLGQFSLTVTGTPRSLTVSFIGYRILELPVGSAGSGTLTLLLEKGPLDLKEVVITSNSRSSTFHNLSRIDLNLTPARSAQDLLRLVPGLFIAQHQGGGKAEQIFLRGFDADHGTDVAVSVDGLPVNMVSQAHGQGYADLHFLIPETVAGYDFGKGPYYADKGDFNTAGYIAYQTRSLLDKNMVKLEGGLYNTGRIVTLLNLLGSPAAAGKPSAYVAAEAQYSDGGPFSVPEHFNRGNLFGKFNACLGASSKLTLTLSTFSSAWRASGEIPERAVSEGYISGRFGALDSLQGGYTSRSNALVKITSTPGHHYTLENTAFYSRYFFNLVSNFTFHYFYPGSGDEFRQHESRNLLGYDGRISRQFFFSGLSLLSAAGAGIRQDGINPSYIAHVQNGGTILNYLQAGHTRESNLHGYLEQTLEAGRWLINGGLRFDYFRFFYANTAPVDDTAAAVFLGRPPKAAKSQLSPKLNFQYTVSPQLQFYLKTGRGFHSNDARIVIANQGYQVLPEAWAADLGLNWKPLPRLFINTALWYLYLAQEFTFGSDLGDQSVSPGGKTRREGIDFSARYQINDWLYGNLNLDLARPRSIGEAKGMDYLPLAPTFTSTAGLDVRFKNGLNGALSYRYMHDRPGNADYSLTAKGYFVTDLTANYTTSGYEIGIAVENLLNISWDESEFEYLSRLKGESRPVDQMSYTPGVPFFLRLKCSLFF